MTFSILAVVFLLFLLGAIFYGYGFMMKKGAVAAGTPTGRCTLCERKFDTTALVVRRVGDATSLFFCKECIGKLYADARGT